MVPWGTAGLFFFLGIQRSKGQFVNSLPALFIGFIWKLLTNTLSFYVDLVSFWGLSVQLSNKHQSLPSLREYYFWHFFKSLLVFPYSQSNNLPLTRLAKLPLHLFPLPFIFLSPFILCVCVHADSLVPLLLNYALLFPQPEEVTAEALLLTLFCIPSMSFNLFWVLFAAKMLTQHQFCFHGLTG